MLQGQAHRSGVTRDTVGMRASAADDRQRRVRAFGFGRFRLDLEREQLVGPGGRLVLRRQAFATLAVLLDAAPAVVTLDQLLDRVWGRHAISPSAVPHVIVELRRVLGDSARTPCYIETRHRRGYRVIPAVVRDLARPAGSERPSTPASAHPDSVVDLLHVIEQAGGMSRTVSPWLRLRQLHDAAAERGLTWLALQVQQAMRDCVRNEARQLACGAAQR